MTSVGEKTYSEFGRAIRNWMDEQRLEYPMDLYDRLRRLMGNDAPSYSHCKMAYLGKRKFELHVVLFMMESLNFKIRSRQAVPDKNRDNEVTKIKDQLWFRTRGIR